MRQYGDLNLVSSGSLLGVNSLELSPNSTQVLNSIGSLYYNSVSNDLVLQTDIGSIKLTSSFGTKETSWGINILGNTFTIDASNIPVGGITIPAENIVTTDGSQVLTNKIIDVNQLRGLIDVALLPSNIVTTDGIQTLTNKTIDASQLVGNIIFSLIESIVGTGHFQVARGDHNHLPFASHLGTSDGTATAVLPFPNVPIAFISDPLVAYKVNGWQGTSRVVVNTPSFVVATPNPVTHLQSGTILTLLLTNSDGVILLSDTLICNENASQTSVLGKISTTGVSKSANNRFEGLVSFNIDYSSLVVGGYVKVHVNQNVTDNGIVTDYPQDFEFVYDNGTTSSISSVGISENTINSDKWVSGVRYYSNTDTFNITAVANNAFSKSYVTPLLVFDCSQFGINLVNVAFNDSHISGVSTPPRYTDVLTYTNTAIPITLNNVLGYDAKVSVRVNDAFSGSTTTLTTSNKILVNTYPRASTDVYETFIDEWYRLDHTQTFDTIPSVYTGVWDSHLDITTHYGNTGLLQYNGDLVFPNIDFSLSKPTQLVNYTGQVVPKYYARLFRASGVAHSNCTLRLGGITFSDIDYTNLNRSIKVEIRLSSGCPWLDVGRAFNAADFPNINNGCLISYISNPLTLSLTFGPYTTADSNYAIVCRITALKSTMSPINYVQVTDW
jgi:hypothetical protein